MSTVIRGRIPEHATLRYQEESVDDVQIPYDITFKLVGYESVQIEKQIKAIREAIKKKNYEILDIVQNSETPPPTVGSDVTLRQNWSVNIRCRTIAVGAALALW